MKSVNKILLLAGAALGIYYIPTILAVMKVEISLFSFLPVNIRESKIDSVVGVKLKNNSSIRVRINWIKADILLNGQKIAEFYQNRAMMLLPRSQQNFNVNFTIDAETIGNEIWVQLMAQNLQNSNLEVTGTLNANNKTLPFSTIWTVKDLAQGIGKTKSCTI